MQTERSSRFGPTACAAFWISLTLLAAPARALLPASPEGVRVGGPMCPLDDRESHAPGIFRNEPSGETTSAAAVKDSTKKDGDAWYVNEAHGPCDTLRFEVNEGTWLSVDIHPDGRTLVFDLLGDLYTMPIAGGAATRLTKGPAWDFQPRWSRDGESLVFTSDRGGSDNIWMMHAGGSGLRALTSDKEHICNSPGLSSDGQWVVYKKRFTDGSSIGRTELWISSTRGGVGYAITNKDELSEINEPCFSTDGRFVYYSARFARYQYNRNVLDGIYQVRRYDRVTGTHTNITDGYGGSVRPTLSPDGKQLAFIRRDRLESVLYLYDLELLTERPVYSGLSQDMQENFAWTGSYPGISFTPDGRSLVAWAKGKLWRIDLASGEAAEIPFRADVEQIVDEALRWPREVAPESLRVRMISWPVQSPDGKELLFAAIGSLWSKPLPDGTPRKLTTDGGLAYSPTYSPDGKWIAYVSWSDREGGYLWKMPARGGKAIRLTSIPSTYANPAFSSDGSKIVLIRGNNAAFRGGNLGDDAYHDLMWMPSAGGPANYIMSIGSRGSTRRMPRPAWNTSGDRVYYITTENTSPTEEKTALWSVKLDGTDRVEHLRTSGAEEIFPSPDGRWVAYRQSHNAYVAEMPMLSRISVSLGEEGGAVPTRRFTKDGGEWLNWADGGRTVTWSWGSDFYRVPVDSVMAFWDRQALEAAKKSDPAERDRKAAEAKAKEEKAKEEKSKAEASADSSKAEKSGEDDQGKDAKPKDEPTLHPDTLSVSLELPRAKPKGTIALVGGRLITMKGKEVIENGTIVIEDNRIVAVGPSATTKPPAGARVFDVKGATLMPGMIDTHAHLHFNSMDILPEQQWANWCNLAFGVTTTHDPSASTYLVFTESEMIEAGVMKGPRTYSTGYILYGATDPNGASIQSLEDAQHHVKRLKRLGSFSVKSYMQPRREQRQWIIEAARAESVLVVPEGGGNLEMNLSMVLDGHTSIEHSLPVAPIYDDVARLFGGSGTVETPTLLVAYGGISGEHWFYQHDEVWKNEKLLRFHPRGPIDARSIRRPIMTIDGDWHHMDVALGCKKIVEAGGRVTLGAHGQLQGLGPHWELWALTQGGMTNHDALLCATRSGAWELGLDGDLGTLEPGKLADLLVLNRNPLERIENSNSLRYVIKNGELWDADTMDQLWPESKPCPKFIFQALGGGSAGAMPRSSHEDE